MPLSYHKLILAPVIVDPLCFIRLSRNVERLPPLAPALRRLRHFKLAIPA